MSDDLRIAASREGARGARRPQPTYTPPPPPVEKPMSPWIPFLLSFILIAGTAGGLFYYMDTQFKSLHASLLKTNDYVVGLNKRVTKLEDKLSKSNDDADASLTSKLINLETRLEKAESGVTTNTKNVGWNSSRIGTQITTVEGIESNVGQQQKTLSTHTIQIQALNDKDDGSGDVAALSKKVDTNAQAIETIDAHRDRLSSAIQKVQGDTARLIRLYSKDNPSAKRVH